MKRDIIKFSHYAGRWMSCNTVLLIFMNQGSDAFKYEYYLYGLPTDNSPTETLSKPPWHTN